MTDSEEFPETEDLPAPDTDTVELEGRAEPGYDAPGVDIPKRLIERFPDEMTIVLQNRFWDLAVDDAKFSVGLSFNQVPSKLVIPYSAITGFHDPAVAFELRFQAQEGPNDGPTEHDAAENDGPTITPADDGSNVVSVDFKRKK